jgi:hypothetical protein
MSLEHAPQRQGHAARSTRYLTKQMVAERYGWASKISVDRAWKQYGTLPPPIYRGKFPIWAEHVLDAHDAQSQQSTVIFSDERKKAHRLNLLVARKARAKKAERRKRRRAFAK